MERRGYKPDATWKNTNYRGKALGYSEDYDWNFGSSLTEYFITLDVLGCLIYPEHNNEYLQECIDNLKSKGIEIDYKV